MKTILLDAFVIILLLVVKDVQLLKIQKSAKNGIITSISTGTSFGECISYCLRSINITNNPLKLVASKETHWDRVTYPTIQKQFSFTLIQWQNLLAALNIQKFQSLNDRIGCPDCADGGAEWIQVDWPTKSKRVTFEYGKSVNEINELIKSLRLLRELHQKNL